MKKKTILIILFIVILLIIMGAAAFFLLNKKPTTSTTPSPVSAPVDNSEKIAADLEAAFKHATTTIGLPSESIFMVNAYAGDESKPTEQNFSLDTTTNKQFYMASTIKPLFLAAYLNLLNIKDIDTKIPLKFVDDGTILKGIAIDLSNKINYNYDEDIILDLYILPFFKGYSNTSTDEILNVLETNPEIVNYQFSLRDIIKYTLGPSSNLGLTILRQNLALVKGVSEEEGSNLAENYLNKMLTDKGLKGSIVLNKSTKSKAQQTLNAAEFDEIEYLFDWLYKNEFNLPVDVLTLMKESMRDIGADPVKFNRRHETKSIASKVLATTNFKIVEKSGYIGFDYEAAPGLNVANGWDKLPAQAGKRIVFFDGSAFARIYLNNGKFVQYNFSIASPVYISTDPAYEELNNDYLPFKNKIFDSLETNIGAVFTKYKEDIVTK